MRFSDDKPLAKAIESGVRYDRLRVRIGWKDDDFESPLSDWSECVTSMDTGRSLDTSLPDSAQIVQGASIGTGKLKLGGQRDGDRLPVAKMFNPYRGDSPLYGYRILDVPVLIDSVVPTEDGDRVIREFTGLIRNIDIDPAENTVEIELWDVPQWLQAVVSFPRVALMARDTDAYNWHACIATGTWVIAEAMRQCGFTTGPEVFDSNDRKTYAYWSLMGGYVFNVGRMPANGGLEFLLKGEAQKTGEAWDDIEDKWVDGPHGIAANRPKTPLMLDCDLDGTMYVPKGNVSETQTVGVSCWIRAGEDDIGDWTQIAVGWGLKDPDGTDVVSDNYGATLTMARARDDDFLCTFEDLVSNTKIPVGFEIPRDDEWHFLTGMVEFGNETTVSVNLDGDVLDSSTFPDVPNIADRVEYIEPGHARVILDSPMQHVNVWWQRAKAEDCVLPKDPPTGDDSTPMPDLSTSLQLLVNLPEIVNKAGWDVIKGVCNAEYGIIYTTPEGVLRFRNRADLNELYGKTQNTRPKSVRTITGDVFDNIPITTDVDSVRNDITYKVRAKLSDWRVAFKADDPFRYYTPAGDTKQWPDEPLEDDVMYMTRGGGGSVYLSHNETQLPETWAAFCNTDAESFTDRQTGVNFIVGQGENQRAMRFWVVNDAGKPNIFAFPKQSHDGDNSPDATPPQPALSIMGIAEFDAGARAFDGRKQDTDSIDKYRARTLQMEGDDWLQSRASADWIASYLMDALHEPTPVTDKIEIPHDPRLELGDAITLEDSQSGSTLQVAISGIDAEWSTDKGFVDKLTVKFLQQQYDWILGDSSRSILGQSTRI